MRDLGGLLISLRGNLSLREAAKKSGLSYSYISSLEKGRHPRTGAPINPTPEILRSLSKAYNYSYEDLMKLAGYTDEDGNIQSETEESNMDRMKREIMDIVKLARTEEDVKSVLHVIKKALKE